MSIVLLASNIRVLVGSAIPRWDADAYFCPYFIFLADHLRSLQLPGWDPFTQCGVPVYCEPQVGAMSPVTLGFSAVLGGGRWGYAIYWLTIWWAGAMGMLVLARHLRSAPWCGMVAALGFMACSLYVGQAQHMSHVVSFSFLPWIVWRLDGALQEKRLLPAVQAGALWGLSSLSGYPGLTLGTAIFCGMWVMARLERGRILHAALVLAAYGLVGCVVLAPAYWAFYREGSATQRTLSLSRESAIAVNSLTPSALSTFSSPALAVVEDRGRHWLWPEPSMCSIYVGVMVVMLAGFALGGSDRRLAWAVAVMGASFLCMALGPATPVRGWLYDWCAPSRLVRHSALFRDYFMLSLCILAALGGGRLAEWLSQGRRRSVWVGLGVTGVAALACGGYFASYKLPYGEYNVYLAVGAAGLLMWGILPLLLWAGAGDGTVVRAVIMVAVVDALFALAVSQPNMVAVGKTIRGRWDLWAETHRRSPDVLPEGWSRVPDLRYPVGSEHAGLEMNQLLAKRPSLAGYTVLENQDYAVLLASGTLQRMACDTRVWFCASPSRSEGSDATRDAIIATVTHDGYVPMVLDGGREAPRGGLARAVGIGTKLIGYSANELEFDAECPSDGWVMVTDRWSESWRAWVSGREVPIERGNLVFRCVPVLAGQNRIRMEFDLKQARILMGISWTTLVLAGIGTLSARWRRATVVSQERMDMKVRSEGDR